MIPSLKSQDVVVLTKLFALGRQRRSFAELGVDLSISPSEVHAAVRRLRASRLLDRDTELPRPDLQACEEFLVHGLKYIFPAIRANLSVGILTSFAALPISRPREVLPAVWPIADGTHRGIALEPLYKTVPQAAMRDQTFYELLVVLDAIRESDRSAALPVERRLITMLRRHSRR
jgi:hypothetical protein